MPISQTYSDLNVVHLDGTDHKVIAEGGWEAIPTDRSILFANGNFKLFEVDYDGSNLAQFYPSTLWGDHQLSPDGKKILVASGSFESAGYLSEMYLVNLDGSNLTRLGPPKSAYAWPRISPDLDEIAFYRDGGIGVINADGTNFHYIKAKTDSTSGSYAVYLDQNRVIYFENSNTFHYIHLYYKTSGEDTVVGTSSTGAFNAFARSVVGAKFLNLDNGSIRLFNFNTGEVLNLGSAWGASFSSDGSRIVANDAKSIYTMDTLGQKRSLIYTEQDSTKSINNPWFSPDNNYIVFQRMWTVYKF